MRKRKKPSQSWIERSKYEIENADRLLAERIEKVKEIRKMKGNNMNSEQFKASELVERINELIKKHGDVDVAVHTDEGTFAALGCYYDIFAESIIISE